MGILEKKKFLVVDDEPLICEVLCDFLESEGGQVLSANCGQDALKILSNHSFDVLISDFRMPSGDGRSLVQNIPQEKRHGMLIYFCSGFNDLKQAEIESLGVKHLFAKPFQIQEILEKIKKDLEFATEQKTTEHHR